MPSPRGGRACRGNAPLAAGGESLASHRDGRGAPPARRDDREYREYLSEEQRSRRGCIARRMQPDFHHGLLGKDTSFSTSIEFLDDTRTMSLDAPMAQRTPKGRRSRERMLLSSA